MSGKFVFPKAVKELRFLFCQTGEESHGVRTFLSSSYPAMKRSNPNLPILMREAKGTAPTLYTRFDMGRENSVKLSGLSEKEVEEKLASLVKG